MQQIVLIVVYIVLFAGSAAASLPCRNSTNGTSCGFHVFRVVLTGRPEEEGATVTAKQRRKYGSNVYVPTGTADSFNLNLAQEVAEKMPKNIDQRVKDRINDLEFVMKQVDPTAIWLGENDPLPDTFQPIKRNQTIPAHTQPPQTSPRPNTGESRFPLLLTAMLVVIGILLGILCSCGVFLLVSYRKKPRIDRSKMVIHRRPTAMERAMLDRNKRYYDQNIVRVHQVQRISSAQSNSSSRTPRPLPQPPRRQRREDTLPLRTGARSDSERLSEV